MASIRNIAVTRGKAGMEVEIHGVTSAKALKLTGPDRLVLDFANAAAAISCTRIGAMNGIPALEEVRAMMDSGGRTW